MIETPDLAALEVMAAQLEASGRYRLLRRLESCTLAPITNAALLKDGVYIDTETTGTDSSRDEIIELAMVPVFRLAKMTPISGISASKNGSDADLVT